MGNVAEQLFEKGSLMLSSEKLETDWWILVILNAARDQKGPVRLKTAGDRRRLQETAGHGQ